MEHEQLGVGRRSALKAAAWSVPVVATAAAAPLAAASGADITVLSAAMSPDPSRTEFIMVVELGSAYPGTLTSDKVTVALVGVDITATVNGVNLLPDTSATYLFWVTANAEVSPGTPVSVSIDGYTPGAGMIQDVP